jgi:predicted DNA-binding protein (UPF0251 family)
MNSDELITTQEDVLMGEEEIDGIELSESDELFNKQEFSEETLSVSISERKLKDILKHARKKRISDLKK